MTPAPPKEAVRRPLQLCQRQCPCKSAGASLLFQPARGRSSLLSSGFSKAISCFQILPARPHRTLSLQPRLGSHSRTRWFVRLPIPPYAIKEKVITYSRKREVLFMPWKLGW